jgi:hypothetical protein
MLNFLNHNIVIIISMHKPSGIRLKIYAITSWIMLRLGLTQVDETRTKMPESRRNDIVRVEVPNKKSVRRFIKISK